MLVPISAIYTALLALVGLGLAALGAYLLLFARRLRRARQTARRIARRMARG